MKTKYLIIATIFFASLWLSSCLKDDQVKLNENNEQTGLKNTQSSDTIPFIRNPYLITDYLKNKEDIDDEILNQNLYSILLSIRSYFNTNSYNEAILNKAKTTANNSVSLNYIVNNTKFFDAPENEFNIIKSLINNISLTHKSQNPENVNVIELYVPVIYVPNVFNADKNKKPILCISVPVNSNLPGLENYEDYVVAWYFNDQGVLIETLMSEGTVMTLTNPVYIIDNAEETMTNRAYLPQSSSTPILHSPESTTQFHSYEYQINYRYETSNYSEFYEVGAGIDENGNGIPSIFKLNNGTYSSQKKIADVHKSKIGVLQSHWEQFADGDLTPYTQNYIFWNTYERDWYSSTKDLGTGTRYNKTISLDGKRKYSSEWYAYNPSDVNANPLDLNYIYYNWAKWHENSKTKYRIWRVEI